QKVLSSSGKPRVPLRQSTMFSRDFHPSDHHQAPRINQFSKVFQSFTSHSQPSVQTWVRQEGWNTELVVASNPSTKSASARSKAIIKQQPQIIPSKTPLVFSTRSLPHALETSEESSSESEPVTIVDDIDTIVLPHSTAGVLHMDSLPPNSPVSDARSNSRKVTKPKNETTKKIAGGKTKNKFRSKSSLSRYKKKKKWTPLSSSTAFLPTRRIAFNKTPQQYAQEMIQHKKHMKKSVKNVVEAQTKTRKIVKEKCGDEMYCELLDGLTGVKVEAEAAKVVSKVVRNQFKKKRLEEEKKKREEDEQKRLKEEEEQGVKTVISDNSTTFITRTTEQGDVVQDHDSSDSVDAAKRREERRKKRKEEEAKRKKELLSQQQEQQEEMRALQQDIETLLHFYNPEFESKMVEAPPQPLEPPPEWRLVSRKFPHFPPYLTMDVDEKDEHDEWSRRRKEWDIRNEFLRKRERQKRKDAIRRVHGLQDTLDKYAGIQDEFQIASDDLVSSKVVHPDDESTYISSSNFQLPADITRTSPKQSRKTPELGSLPAFPNTHPAITPSYSTTASIALLPAGTGYHMSSMNRGQALITRSLSSRSRRRDDGLEVRGSFVSSSDAQYAGIDDDKMEKVDSSAISGSNNSSHDYPSKGSIMGISRGRKTKYPGVVCVLREISEKEGYLGDSSAIMGGAMDGIRFFLTETSDGVNDKVQLAVLSEAEIPEEMVRAFDARGGLQGRYRRMVSPNLG
ncbi:hypothetical protein ADUPG1_010464, partial [Aduncisulcus paluster]